MPADPKPNKFKSDKPDKSKGGKEVVIAHAFRTLCDDDHNVHIQFLDETRAPFAEIVFDSDMMSAAVCLLMAAHDQAMGIRANSTVH